MRVAILARRIVRPTRVRCIAGVAAALMCRRRWPRAHGTVNQPETLELLASRYSRIGPNNVQARSSKVRISLLALAACFAVMVQAAFGAGEPLDTPTADDLLRA